MGRGGEVPGWVPGWVPGGLPLIPAVVVGDILAAFAQQQLSTVSTGHTKVTVVITAARRCRRDRQFNLKAEERARVKV
jgi:hypothetical protein